MANRVALVVLCSLIVFAQGMDMSSSLDLSTESLMGAPAQDILQMLQSIQDKLTVDQREDDESLESQQATCTAEIATALDAPTHKLEIERLRAKQKQIENEISRLQSVNAAAVASIDSGSAQRDSFATAVAAASQRLSVLESKLAIMNATHQETIRRHKQPLLLMKRIFQIIEHNGPSAVATELLQLASTHTAALRAEHAAEVRSTAYALQSASQASTHTGFNLKAAVIARVTSLMRKLKDHYDTVEDRVSTTQAKLEAEVSVAREGVQGMQRRLLATDMALQKAKLRQATSSAQLGALRHPLSSPLVAVNRSLSHELEQHSQQEAITRGISHMCDTFKKQHARRSAARRHEGGLLRKLVTRVRSKLDLIQELLLKNSEETAPTVTGFAGPSQGTGLTGSNSSASGGATAAGVSSALPAKSSTVGPSM